MKKALRIFIFSICLVLLAMVVFLAVVYYQVSQETVQRVERGVIDRVIFSESPVYYDDGETPIGVFFEKTHRKYIRYEDTPQAFIQAIIAAEDRHFFSHPGFDMRALLRALVANIKAGRTVQGGSTLTQQTAKNVFKRHKKSYMAKLKELIQALLLERKYTKEEILEMYTNQFFVTGFGRGLRIAAQYFFDKEAEDLDLVECAFIAGSVKGPYKYNPFTKKTEAEKREAMLLAKQRKDYVLANMRKARFITREEYLSARAREVPFKEGKVTYALNCVLDYVREQLESYYFRTVLREEGVDNIATSGIKIYTSVNREIQEGALKSLRRHLPLLDIKLSGYNGNPVPENAEQDSGILQKPEGSIPFLGRIASITMDGDNPAIEVSWEGGGGIVDYQGLRPAGEAWLKWEVGEKAVFGREHVPEFLRDFHEGDVLTVQVLEDSRSTGQTRLMLTKIPQLQGGIIVINKGMIKAMVGGFFDRYFNRAVDAKRQLGSIFKPLVYTAALQLKWNSLDPLINMRDVFQFEKTIYVPKPDHEPKANKVSMAWAGVKSENLATVWLLYHLTDRLNMREFRQVVELLGLARKDDESYKAYVERIRDKHGVVVDNEALMEAAFEEAKKEIESDLIFIGHEDALDSLHRLHYRVDTTGLDLGSQEVSQIHPLSFQELRALSLDIRRKGERIKDLLDVYRFSEDPNQAEELSKLLQGFSLVENGLRGPRMVYTERQDFGNQSSRHLLSPEWLLETEDGLALEEIWIDDVIPYEALNLLQSHMKDNYERLLAHKRYDLEVLSRVRDFRTLVNLTYTTRLAREMGITTRLDPVLSFPLGANSIGIIEAALAYSAIMSGYVHRLSDRMAPAMVPIITKIVDREGETLWQYGPQPKRVLTRRVSGLVSEVLRKVVEKGTGRRAKNAIKLSVATDKEKLGIPIPCFGKTGTANRYTNSSFVGFIPGPRKKSGHLDLQEGYVITSYVGYDDNRPMKGRHVEIYGASGALPLWIDTANAVANSNDYLKGLEVADLAFDVESVPIINDESLSPVPVSERDGLPLGRHIENTPDNPVQILSDVDINDGRFRLRRAFEPLTGADYEKAQN